jgi:hypothetical protein
LQPRSALFADPPVDIGAQALSARRAFPVLGGIADVRGDNNGLRPKECAFGKFSEVIGALIDNCAQENEKERCRYRDELTVLASMELLHDLFGVFFLCHRSSLLVELE